MTETILALIPHYGLFVVFSVVFLACLAVPLPSSMLVLSAGSFAASGDLSLWLVLGVTFSAFVLGDQVAFHLARHVGGALLTRFRARPRLAPILKRSEVMLRKRGPVAVLLSHTVLSPTCPYVSYLCGAGGLARSTFTVVGALGAAIWTSAYVGLGFVFATQLEQVAVIVGNGLGVILALCATVFSIWLLRSRWLQRGRIPAP